MVGQSVPVTGICLGVAKGFKVAEGVDVRVAEGVAVGVALATNGAIVGLGEGVTTVQSVRSVVQDAPSEGQQNCWVPQREV
jgi:hypothetical protein